MDLLKLNEKFYLKTQEYFNRSRQAPWGGWEKLLSSLRGESSQALKVLDLGCGNGRFGIWLSKHKKIEYIGMDNNQYLLDAAQEKLPEAKLIKQDILKPWELKDLFELVTILGVMHHLPKINRAPMLKRAAVNLKPGGILFLSFWEFNRSQETKIVKKLGNNDFILDWHMGVDAKRYCHLYTQKEILQLIKPLKLKLLADYRADKSNHYLVLIK